MTDIFEKTFEKCAALCIGVTTIAFGMPTGVLEASAASAALIGFVLGRKSRFGPESPRIMRRIRADTLAGYSRLVAGEAGDDEALRELEAADEALNRALSKSIIDRQKLAAAAVSPRGFPEAAVAVIMEGLASSDPDFFGPDARGSLSYRFAADVLRAGLEAAVQDQNYYRTIEPSLTFEMAAALGEVREDTARINAKLSSLPQESAEAIIRVLTEKGLLAGTGDQTKDLRDKIAALEVVNDLMTKFTMTLGYELRMPITNIIGFLHLLTLNDISPEKRMEYIGYAHQSAMSILGLVNDVTDLAVDTMRLTPNDPKSSVPTE